VPATTRTVRAAHPLFKLLSPTLQEAQPIVDYLGLYKEDIVIQLANFGAAIQAKAPVQATGEQLHYLRALVPFLPEGLMVANQRLGSNRYNPYFKPRALERLGQGGLESFDCSHTSNPGAENPNVPCVVQQQVTFQGRRTAYTQVRRVR
jgi:hypothetical protein